MPHTMTYRDIDSVNLPQANRRYFHPQMIHNKQTRNRLGSMVSKATALSHEKGNKARNI